MPAGPLTDQPYAGYAYGYPHKTAYRPLRPPVPLREVWSSEPRDSLFLYLHVPFCEMRCGFCNLFTTANPAPETEARYLQALEYQARQTAAAVAPARFARMAIGGGTPTFLSPAGLNALFDLAELHFGARPRGIPCSVETSPLTATPDRLRVLAERGVERVSIGVQSFVEAEAAAAGRAQRTADVERALDQLRSAEFPVLNLDLIFGLPGQTVDSWLFSLQRALFWGPEELYLYPLYVRPLTGLGKLGARAWDEQRLACYRAGRDLLRAAGYEQVSMRMFRRGGTRNTAGPDYCCQEDGMVGLGCGARSYTRALHYSSEYAVGRTGVREILAAYLAQPEAAFATAEYGIVLDAEEQRRRYVLKSLLQVVGLDLTAYRARFGTEATSDLPQLRELVETGLALRNGEQLVLTERGLELSDAIGPWLYSEKVRAAMEGFPLR